MRNSDPESGGRWVAEIKVFKTMVHPTFLHWDCASAGVWQGRRVDVPLLSSHVHHVDTSSCRRAINEPHDEVAAQSLMIRLRLHRPLLRLHRSGQRIAKIARGKRCRNV